MVSSPMTCRRPLSTSVHVIGRVAPLARFVQRLARREQGLLVALDRRVPRDEAGVNHVLGKLLPPLRVLEPLATGRLQKGAGFCNRRGAPGNRLPFVLGLGRRFLSPSDDTT